LHTLRRITMNLGLRGHRSAMQPLIRPGAVRVFVAAVFVAAACAGGHSADASRDALKQWESAAPTSYRYIYGGFCEGEPVEVVMTAGAIDVADLNRTCLGSPEQSSIPVMFEEVGLERSLQLLGDVAVEYDEEFGFPRT
jgi:hypothetical protein